MKRSFFLLAVCFLVTIGIAYSAFLEVGINEVLDGNISSLSYDTSSNLVKFSIEFYNTGSVPYKARIKIDTYNSTDMLFTGWGKEMELMAGNKEVSDIYWYADKGEYSVKIKAYFGNEIKEYKKFDIKVSETAEPEDNFEIRDLRTYDDHIIFDIYSRKYAEDVVVIPTNYTPGWIFEQVEIEEVPKERSRLVILNYEPSLWKPSNISLQVVSNQGLYSTVERVEMVKEEGLNGFFFYVLDSIRMAFFK